MVENIGEDDVVKSRENDALQGILSPNRLVPAHSATRSSLNRSDAPPADIRGVIEFKARPESLTYAVYEAIKETIIDRRLPANMRVTEAALAKQLVVSKTPVREALLRLKEIGLIEADGSKTARIVSSSFARMRDAYEVREALESTSARVAAERGDRTLLGVVKQWAEGTVLAAELNDPSGYRVADEAFHSSVAIAGGNERLARLIDDANVLINVLRQRDSPELDTSTACAQQHMNIVESLFLGRPDEASERMAEHVRLVRDAVLTSMATNG